MTSTPFKLSVPSPWDAEHAEQEHLPGVFTVSQGGVPKRYEIPLVRQLGERAEPRWFWRGKIRRGQVTVIEGAAGVGKSFVAFDLAARFSRGVPFPDEVQAADQPSVGGNAGQSTGVTRAGDVLLVTLQDGGEVADNRLLALEADRERIVCFGMVRTCEIASGRATRRQKRETSGEFGDLAGDCSGDDEAQSSLIDEATLDERPMAFPFDLPMLTHQLQLRPTIGVIVIDPLSDFCASPARLAETLRGLHVLAQNSGVAVIVTLPAAGRFDAQGEFKSSSRWRTDSARAVWCVACDPDDPTRRLFFPRRTNSMAEPHGMEFRIADERILWNAQALVRPDDPLGRESEIRACLTELLHLESRPAGEIFRLGTQRGFTPARMRSVAKRMGIQTTKGAGFGAAGSWMWSLPGVNAAPVAEPGPQTAVEKFENSKSLENCRKNEQPLEKKCGPGAHDPDELIAVPWPEDPQLTEDDGSDFVPMKRNVGVRFLTASQLEQERRREEKQKRRAARKRHRQAVKQGRR